jgi:hypothetical protein
MNHDVRGLIDRLHAMPYRCDERTIEAGWREGYDAWGQYRNAWFEDSLLRSSSVAVAQVRSGKTYWYSSMATQQALSHVWYDTTDMSVTLSTSG